LKEPLQLLASGVRAVETMTAWLMIGLGQVAGSGREGPGAVCGSG